MPNTRTAPPRTATATVEAFLDALRALDVEAARALMAPDIVYQNVPYPPVRGPEATIRVLRLFLVAATGFEVEMHHIASEGDVVLTERVDALTNGPVRVAFWVCGTFEVRDGLITVWRDRFDHVDLAVALLRGLVQAPLRFVRTRTDGNG